VLGQQVSTEDSVYIYKHFLFYDSDSKTFDDIDEPFIEQYRNTNNEKAKKYYKLSAYLKSIPINQRVIMVSYLDDETKFEIHQWFLNNLKSSKEKTEYYLVLGTGYGFPYSKLGLSKEEVIKHCPRCSYQ
jgi:two-component SAPR family response regulator